MGHNSTHKIDNTRWCWCFFKTLIWSYYSPLLLWPRDVKNWPIGKDPDAGKDWRQEAKGMTENEIVGRYHRLSGHEFEQALGVSDGQGSLACCSPWGHKELDTTEWLNWTDSPWKLLALDPIWSLSLGHLSFHHSGSHCSKCLSAENALTTLLLWILSCLAYVSLNSHQCSSHTLVSWGLAHGLTQCSIRFCCMNVWKQLFSVI